MPEKRILHVAVEGQFFAVLGFSPSMDGAEKLTMTVRRYSDLVAGAAGDLEALLTRKEWDCLAQALHGCHDPWQYDPRTHHPRMAVIRKCVSEYTGEAIAGAEGLAEKLAAANELHADAIMAAVSSYWWRLGGGDPRLHEDEWWRVETRISSGSHDH